MEKKDGRGGRRAGAGRKKLGGKMISFRAPSEMAAQLAAQPQKTQFVRDAVEAALEQRAEASAEAAIAERRRALEQQLIELEQRRRAIERIGEFVPATKVRGLSLPYFDARVVAGFPVPLDNDERSQDIDILTMLCPHPEASYLVKVNGESMIDAGIMSGDIVIVDKSNRNPGPKEIAVCELNGEFTLKHFVMEGGQGWLVPANSDFPRIKVTDDDAFSVWGTVTYIIHKARD